MLKHKLITGASLIVIFASVYGLLKTIFDAPPIQSTRATTIATSATSTPSILSVSTTPGPEPAPEPTQSTATASVATTATSTPSILSASTTPGPEPAPEPTQSTPTTTVEPTPSPKPLKGRVIKHRPDQYPKGALSKEELSAIKKAIRTIQWSRNSDPKAAADEDYAAIVKECENSSVHYLLEDLITEVASNDYQPDNEVANTTYINELISDFKNGVNRDRESHEAH